MKCCCSTRHSFVAFVNLLVLITEVVDRKVMAMASDAVYNTSRGRVRPWQHTVLGLGLRTLTSSKLILCILNRLGHSLSYDEVKALETEFAFSAEANDRDAPDGVRLTLSLGTGLAWDNYDVSMDTMDGKDTLHATVGIFYQNEDVTNTNKPDDVSTSVQIGRKRRQFHGKERETDPYYKQLKKARFDISSPNELQETEDVPKLRVIDFYWLLLSEADKLIPLFFRILLPVHQ